MRHTAPFAREGEAQCFRSNIRRRIGLIGTGSVGCGWAAIYVARGYKVIASDPAPDAETRARAFIADTWDALRKLGIATSERVPEDSLTFVRITRRGRSRAPISCTRMRPENLALKQAVYDEIEANAPATLVIASSTGGIPPTQLQAKMRNPERLVVCHPFNPPHLVPLIEIVGGEKTAPAVVDWALRFFRTLGKQPIRVDKEVTAFLTNRLQFALLREAVHCVAEGIASPQAIEDAMRYGLRPALGGDGRAHDLDARGRGRRHATCAFDRARIAEMDGRAGLREAHLSRRAGSADQGGRRDHRRQADFGMDRLAQ